MGIAVAPEIAQGAFKLNRIGPEDTVIVAGGPERTLRRMRLPEAMGMTGRVSLNDAGDTPLQVRMIAQDGCTAWFSPICMIDRSGGPRVGHDTLQDSRDRVAFHQHEA